MMLRVIVCTFAGAACGALAGGAAAAIAALVIDPIDGSFFFGGSQWDMARFAAALGAVVGSIPGAVIGLVIALAHAQPLSGALIGLAAGLATSLFFFFVLKSAGHSQGRVWLVLSPPFCALVGLAVSALAAKLLR